MNMKILVITPVRHIKGVPEILAAAGEVTYLDDPTPAEVIDCIASYDAIYTNPNKSNVFIGRELMDAATRLKVICTASTGTNHIDKAYAAEKGLPILSLTEERHVIDRISSTAEHAFALTMASLRHVPRSFEAVKNGEWNYEPYIGRQLDHLTVGVVGFGRLGSKYARYCRAFGARVLVCDPYKTVDEDGLEQTDRDELLAHCDIIALHVHVNAETEGMVDKSWFGRMKPDVTLINTARGDLVNEDDMITFLKTNPSSHLATDVVADEVSNKSVSPVIAFAKECDRVIVTPHIGGMTREGQEIAFGHAATRLKSFFEKAHPAQ